MSKKKIVDNSKCTIYCYDLEKRKQSKAIPIKSVCYEKNLYEVLDNNGNVVLQNYIEKVFGKLEAEFSKYRNMLERKAFLPENYSSHMFLKHEEKAFWATYITLQLL